MLKIIKYPDEILNERVPDFDFSNPSEDPKQLEKEMLETMYAHEGIGLSANQVGKRIRMFVMGNPQEPEKGFALFNPIVVAHTDNIEELNEGCLSFPGIYVKIKRPAKIRARWQNSIGEWEESEFSNYDCKCFLHELDHLEGIVYKNRVSDIKWALAVKKSKKGKY
jgi:peptide deformylase